MDVADGQVNILIGTHRIVSKDVKFKDLGLLIIDEEQKFGVSVKEKLRQMKVNVDTLTMTATPIPRTLQFSLMGARDLSSITTPPPNRYPVQTEVERFNPDIIREAINFEMSRNGQVFFINNRIQNIYEIENLVRREVPDARVAVGHGQMEPEKLEKIILDFVNYEYDVLDRHQHCGKRYRRTECQHNHHQQRTAIRPVRPAPVTRTCRTKQPQSLLLPALPASFFIDTGGTPAFAGHRELL